jgi:hypothetical protein
MKKEITLNIHTLIGQVNYIVLPGNKDYEELEHQTYSDLHCLQDVFLAAVLRVITTSAKDTAESSHENKSQQ